MKKLYPFGISVTTLILIMLWLFGNTQDVHVLPGTTMTINSGTTLTITSGDLVLQDDDSHAPSFLNRGTLAIDQAGKESIVEQYVTKDTWHIISSPHSNAEAGDYMWMYLYDYLESSNSWGFISSISTPLPAGKGYFLYAYTDNPGDNPDPADVAELKGSLNQTNVTVDLSYSAASEPGWNVVGNPYPCAIDWNDHTDWVRTNVDATIYVYELGATSSGNYRSYNWFTEVGLPAGPPPNDGKIAATQGFWVKANAPGASLTIPQSQRLHSEKAFYKKGKAPLANLLRMRVNCLSSNYFCESIVAFHPKSTSGFDGLFDGYYKAGHEEAPYLYSMMGGIKYAMNFQGEIKNKTMVPVHMVAPTKDQYVLSFENIQSFQPNQHIYLEDRLLQKVHKVEPGMKYAFMANQKEDPYRFNLLFYEKKIEKDVLVEGPISIYASSGTLHIILPEELLARSTEPAQIYVYSILGQQMLSTRSTGSHTEINMQAYDHQQLIVKVIHVDGTQTAKVYLQ